MRSAFSGWAGLLSLALLLIAPGCRGQTTESEIADQPAPLAGAECGSCGMIVAEQPAPRAQLVHRDGERRHFCSLADLVHYIAAPSRHGKPRSVFVEVQPEDLDPAENSLQPHPFQLASNVHYVVGVPRRGVMGEPVLTFASPAAAAAVATRHGGRLVGWKELHKEIMAGAGVSQKGGTSQRAR